MNTGQLTDQQVRLEPAEPARTASEGEGDQIEETENHSAPSCRFLSETDVQPPKTVSQSSRTSLCPTFAVEAVEN